MEYSILKENDVNVDEALNRFSDNKELFEKYIKKFPDDSSYKNLVIAYNDKNYEEMENSVHSLKGVAGTLGINRVYEPSCKMLTLLRQGNKEEAETVFPLIKEEYDKIVKIILSM